jgi:hypothetical protein
MRDVREMREHRFVEVFGKDVTEREMRERLVLDGGAVEDSQEPLGTIHAALRTTTHAE